MTTIINLENLLDNVNSQTDLIRLLQKRLELKDRIAHYYRPGGVVICPFKPEQTIVPPAELKFTIMIMNGKLYCPICQLDVPVVRGEQEKSNE